MRILFTTRTLKQKQSSRKLSTMCCQFQPLKMVLKPLENKNKIVFTADFSSRFVLSKNSFSTPAQHCHHPPLIFIIVLHAETHHCAKAPFSNFNDLVLLCITCWYCCHRTPMALIWYVMCGHNSKLQHKSNRGYLLRS